MTIQEQEQLVYKVISAVAESQGLDLVELKMGGNKHDIFIQVLADKAGGIDLEACSALNRSIVEAIDKEGFFSEDGYSLEVASPGLDRPMVTYKDFLRNMDQEIHLWLKVRILEKMEHKGKLKAVTENSLTLVTGKDKKEVIIPMDQVMKGLLVI